MDPLTPLDTLCRIILRGREYEAQTPTDYEGNETADDVDDEDAGTLSVLDDTLNDSVEEELRRSLEQVFEPSPLRIAGLGLHRYLGGPWDTLGVYKFRGVS
jgi:hypothetical protein